ncbi:MAG: hypothetical protein GC160_11420 [Acidobacteria bacterium]|nr:hypothetical protein [Acidobacteriota bacterium]
MVRSDYVLRLIEQFFQILKRVLNYRQERRYAEALTAVRKAYRAFLGVDADFIDSQSAEGLIEMGRSGLFGPEQLAMAAKLLSEEAESLEGLEAPLEAGPRRAKALALFWEAFLGRGAPRLEFLSEDVDALLERLEGEGLPLSLARQAPLWHERRGRLSAAEDAWFRLAEAGDGASREAGDAFYGRLEALGDEELEAGGLPRDEVEDGLEAWRAAWARRDG